MVAFTIARTSPVPILAISLALEALKNSVNSSDCSSSLILLDYGDGNLVAGIVGSPGIIQGADRQVGPLNYIEGKVQLDIRVGHGDGAGMIIGEVQFEAGDKHVVHTLRERQGKKCRN